MDFKLLGLTLNEEKAYRILVKMGKLTAAETSRESGVSYSKIYDVLASLEHKGFVKVIPEGAKKFVPSDPQRLQAILDAKKKELDELEEHIAEMKKTYDFHEDEAVQIARGTKNFWKILKDLDEPKTFNYSIKHGVVWHPETVRKNKEYQKQGIDSKVLARVSEKSIPNIKKWLGVHDEFHVQENNGVAMGITDTEVLLVLINQNIIMTIKDTAFAEIMKDLFAARYKETEHVNTVL